MFSHFLAQMAPDKIDLGIVGGAAAAPLAAAAAAGGQPDVFQMMLVAAAAAAAGAVVKAIAAGIAGYLKSSGTSMKTDKDPSNDAKGDAYLAAGTSLSKAAEKAKDE